MLSTCQAGSDFELCFGKIADTIVTGRNFFEEMLPDKLLQIFLVIVRKIIEADAEPLEEVILGVRLNRLKNS